MDNLQNRLSEICLTDAQNFKDIKIWDINLKELYRLALYFYKDQSGKALHLTYEENLKLVAFTQQATHGAFDMENSPPLGVLDVIGRDRRTAWQNLGNISKDEAMEAFINYLDSLCPSFKPYIEAIKKVKEERIRISLEKEKVKRECEEKDIKLKNEQNLDDQQYEKNLQREQLQDALNHQTYHQFKAYSEKQYPGNPEQQAILIKQLQNEHYHQYMHQIYSQGPISTEVNLSNEEIQQNIMNPSTDSNDNVKDNIEKIENSDDSGEYVVVSPAKLWTRPDIITFKQEVSAGCGDGVINVGHGDIVTVRVPTNEGGSCIFWEFATDDYDIGFGVYFEWGKPSSIDVTVHVSESDDDEDLLEEENCDEILNNDDIESGTCQAVANNSVFSMNPPISIIIPVYRRECQNEVYVGSHSYPGEGVYLLKFDNSFSIWRSKTLYYRVYYERQVTEASISDLTYPKVSDD